MGIKEYIESKKVQKELGDEKYRKVLDVIKDATIDYSRCYPTEYFAATRLIDNLREARLRVAGSDLLKFVGVASIVGGAYVLGQASGDVQQILAGVACSGTGAILGAKGIVNGIKAKENYYQCRDLLKRYLRLRADDSFKTVVNCHDINESEYVEERECSIGGVTMSSTVQDTCLSDACDELAEGV